MEQLAYTSIAADSIDSGEVFNIVTVAARKNPERGITGFLAFDGKRFLQVVEGESDALDDLMDELQRDRRHRNIDVLDRRQVAGRCFADWSMRRVGMGRDQEALVPLVERLDDDGQNADIVEELRAMRVAA